MCIKKLAEEGDPGVENLTQQIPLKSYKHGEVGAK